MMKDLITLRAEIDNLDGEILALLLKRFDASIGVRTYKKEHEVAVLDSNREAEILEYVANFTEDTMISMQLVEIYRAILATSKEVQK
ncbi:hypothetical protein AwErysi_05980 [Erysipelotrichaceae bacterium]|nr:hypothetical protein AwErysi_05980 [Erysipelotrichaceae bacterium]